MGNGSLPNNIRSGRDHHKTFDDISRYIDGVVDELFHLYCVNNGAGMAVSMEGFPAWVGSLRGNGTIYFLFQQCFQYGMGIILYRYGIRHNVEELSRLGWDICSPLIHCRNHPRYHVLVMLHALQHVR